MGPMDRRAFLFGALRPAAPDRAFPAVLSADAPSDAPLSLPDAVFRIGRWPDFPLGETRRVGPRAVLIESLAEGLRARSGNPCGPCYAIESNAAGELSVNMSVTWNEDKVFSIMLGGPVRLETHPEENDERR